MDLDTGRGTWIDQRGTRLILSTVVKIAKSDVNRMDVIRVMHPVKVKGGCVVYQGSLCVWSTTLDRLYSTGADVSHILNFWSPY